MKTDLYKLPTVGLALAKACGGNSGDGESESCATIGTIPGTVDAYALGDSKLGAGSPLLRFTGAELDALAARINVIRATAA
ncbi:DUF397 domain-containing protein [Kitasatospora sp. NPDC092948]|uniref:DUF397 domain-containing protein n=1 Tax=Kitasatospora sp. NPDC092948 TaxID=3364088 RepID=UPI003822F07B